MSRTASSGTKVYPNSDAKKVLFEFFAPEAREVYLAGSFNEWDFLTGLMKKNKNGYWRKTLLLKP